MNMSSPQLEIQDSIIKFPSKKYFLLCQRCFWCASCLGKWNISRCPCCDDVRLDSMPISFNDDAKRT